jgi:hypothetical protein
MKLKNSLFNSILDNIYPDNKRSEIINQKAFDQIDVFVNLHFKDDFCQMIINSIGPETDLRKVAIMLDILVWSTPDNGTKLDKLTKGWLESGDLNKVKCLLYRHEWLPTNIEWKTCASDIIKFDYNLKKLVDYYTEEVEYSKKTGLRRTELLVELIKNSR